MVSIKEKIAGFEAKIAEQDSELVAVKAAFDEYKADSEAKIAEHEAVKAEMGAVIEAGRVQIEELEKKGVELAEQIKVLEAERDGLKAKVELTPAMADAVDGQKPVADGSVKVEEIDYVAEMNKLPLGSAEQIAFYRANKEEIDAAYRK